MTPLRQKGCLFVFLILLLTSCFLLLDSNLLPLTSYLLPPPAYAQEAPTQPSLLEQGKDLLDKKEFDAAITVLKEAASLNPEEPMPHYHTGVAYFRMRKFDLAIEALKRALELDPGLAAAHTGLGAIYEIKGENDLARKEYNMAIDGGDSEGGERLKLLEAKERKERRARLRRAAELFSEGKLEESLKELEAMLNRDPDDAEVLYNMGLAYAKMGGYKEAIERLKRVIGIEPGNTGAHLQIGIIYSIGGAYGEAKGEFEAVIAIAPESKDAGRAREELLNVEKRREVAEYFRKASEYREKKEFDTALSMARKILSIEPENIFALYDIAVTYTMMEKRDEAIEVLKRAIKINPDYIEAHLELGLIYESTERYDEAIVEYMAASGKETEESKKAAGRLEGLKRIMEVKGRGERIKILLEGGDLTGALGEAEAYVSEEKNNPKAHFTLGRIYLRLGKVTEAAARLKTAIEIDPGYWEAYLYLGEAYEAMGRYQEAREAYRAIISGASDSPEGREAKGRVGRVTMAIHFETAKGYLGKGDFEGALGEIRKVLEIAPDNPVALYNAGVIYDRLDRPEEAEGFLKRAIEINPGYVQAHLQLALVYEKVQRFDKAEAGFKTILSLTEKGREADIAKARLGLLGEVEVLNLRMRRSNELIRAGNYAEAQKEVESAISLSPENYIAHYTSGVILDKMDRREEAIVALKRTIEIKEDYAPAHLYLGTVYEKENLFRDAREEYRKAMTLGEGMREGEIAAIRLKRLRNWRGNFSIGNTIDTNLSYGAKRQIGTGTGYGLSLSYYLLRAKGNLLSTGFSASRSITHKVQLWGEGYDANVRYETTTPGGYRLATGGNYTYNIFDRKPSYRTRGYFGELSIPTAGIPTSLAMRYSFSSTDSFMSKASDAYQHSANMSTSQRFSAKDTVSGSYSFSSYMNKDPLGSNYASRSNSLSISYSRFISPGLSGNAGYNISLTNYMNPDSETFYTRFRRNISQGINMGVSYALSERVSMSITYNHSNVATNLPRPTAEEQQKLADILAAPIPTVGGGYIKDTLTMGVGVAF